MAGGDENDWGGRVWVAEGSRGKRERPEKGGRETRRSGKRETRRLGNRNGGGRNLGEAVTGSRRKLERHTHREISRERRGQRHRTQREKPRDWGEGGGWGRVGVRERRRGQGLGNRKKEETVRESSREGGDRWGGTERD